MSRDKESGTGDTGKPPKAQPPKAQPPKADARIVRVITGSGGPEASFRGVEDRKDTFRGVDERPTSPKKDK